MIHPYCRPWIMLIVVVMFAGFIISPALGDSIINTHSIDIERDATQYLSITDGSQTGLDLDGDYTFELWVKFESQGEDAALISKRNPPLQRGYGLYVISDPGPVISAVRFTNSSDGYNLGYADVPWYPAMDTWYHVAVVIKNSINQMELFVNGTSKGIGSGTGILSSTFNNTAEFRIGNDDNISYFDGQIDEVRVWSSARSGSDIRGNMFQILTGNESHLEGYWRLSGTLSDHTPNNNDLSNINGAVFSGIVPFPPYTLAAVVDNSCHRDWNDLCGLSYNWDNYEAIDVGTREDINRTSRGMVKFDVSAIPAGTNICSARLRLNKLTENEYILNPFHVSRITEDWDSNEMNWCDRFAGVPWSTPGISFTTAGQTTQLIPAIYDSWGMGPREGWIEWDVTQIVQAWIDDGEPDYGFAIWQTPMSGHGRNQQIFFSANEHADPGRPGPQLVILTECPQTGITTLLFNEQYSTDANFIRDDLTYPDGERYVYASKYVEITRNNNDKLFLSSSQALAEGLFICDDDVLVNGYHAGPGPYTVIDSTYQRGMPIQTILEAKPVVEIPESLIPLGTSCIKFELVDTQREILGNTAIYLIKDPEVSVQISNFTAEPTAAGVLLAWTISSDTRIQGLRIYKRELGKQSYEQVNRGTLIPVERNSYVDRDVICEHSYEYFLVAVKDDGSESQSHTITVKTMTRAVALLQNTPNPFNPMTIIGFVLSEKTKTNLSIFDVQGKLITTLVDAVIGEAYHEVAWDGKDALGNPVPSGIYLYRLKAGTKVLTKKMALLK